MDASLSHEPSPVDGAIKALAWLGGLRRPSDAAAAGAG